MLYFNKSPLILPPLFVLFILASTQLSLAHDDSEINVIKGRTLMGFKETPTGGNDTFDCSPSGPCIPCSRSEKSDKKYRCGETGYRIRLKCASFGSASKDAENLEARKTRSMLEHTGHSVNQLDGDLTISSKSQRRLLGDSSRSKGGSSGAYVTYRSCIPAVNEEKMSVFGFEALMLGMLMGSGSFIYVRRKRSSSSVGGAPVRLPSRF